MAQAPSAHSAMPMLTPDMDFDAASWLVVRVPHSQRADGPVGRHPRGERPSDVRPRLGRGQREDDHRLLWDGVLSEEEDRFGRFADPIVAVVLDLDMLESAKSSDAVARLGGDELGVLLRACTELEADG